jgi:hypothetical protein
LIFCSFPTEILYAFIISSMRTVWFGHLILLGWITLIILDRE